MHGSFHSHRDGMSVCFGAPVPDSSLPRSGKWRAKAAALLAGCCVTALPIASVPTTGPKAAQESPVHIERAAGIVALSGVGESFAPVIAAPIVDRPGSLPSVNAPPPVAVVPANPLPHVPVEITSAPRPTPGWLPQPVVIEATIVPDIPRIAVAPLPRPPLAVSLPDPVPAPSLAMAETPPSAPPAAASLPLAAPRKVDVVQIAESEVHPPRVPQLHEPGLTAGTGETLATKIAAMQVTPPPPVRLRDSDRARLLAEAPTNMILRIGDSALGKVDFRMTGAQGIDVKLAGLLDLLAGHYDAAEFARLRGSAAADAYVSFDQLRALGLSVRYDPVYDELRING